MHTIGFHPSSPLDNLANAFMVLGEVIAEIEHLKRLGLPVRIATGTVRRNLAWGSYVERRFPIHVNCKEYHNV